MKPRAARGNHPLLPHLLDRISRVQTPRRIAVDSEVGFQPHNCFVNVQMQINQKGGTIQHGWALWEIPGIFIEAEFHAIWISPGGEWIDITPNDCSHILFAPDPERTWDECKFECRDNVRLAVCPHPSVKEFIAAAEALFNLQVQYTDPLNPRLFHVPSDIYEAAVRRKMLAELALYKLQPDRNSQCPCGSRKKFKRCCA